LEVEERGENGQSGGASKVVRRCSRGSRGAKISAQFHGLYGTATDLPCHHDRVVVDERAVLRVVLESGGVRVTAHRLHPGQRIFYHHDRQHMAHVLAYRWGERVGGSSGGCCERADNRSNAEGELELKECDVIISSILRNAPAYPSRSARSAPLSTRRGCACPTAPATVTPTGRFVHPWGVMVRA
jgi:hypothetical protein